MKTVWRNGNRVSLLENGEEFYPRAWQAIEAAQQEVLIETFIIFEDEVGRRLQEVLIAAARRGVHVDLIVDGYGSADLTRDFVRQLTDAGVHFHVFDPKPRVLGIRTNLFRRLHRKLLVVDGRTAFVGGINFSHDHLRSYGKDAKQDYAVEVEGPVVADVRRLSRSLLPAAPEPLPPRWHWRRWRRPLPPSEATVADAGNARVLLVVRDNEHHRDDIERHYREAIRSAQREVIIANAYFFPGFGLLRDLRNAARRGVRVRLILQGNPDKAIVKWAAQKLYEYLLRAGAEIHEYCERPLHGKVALVDEEWITVGSSNLDPLSLYLNLEANLVIVDREFNREARASLDNLMQHHCQLIKHSQAQPVPLTDRWLSAIAFHLLRHFPSWAGWLPGHKHARPALHANAAALDGPGPGPG